MAAGSIHHLSLPLLLPVTSLLLSLLLTSSHALREYKKRRLMNLQPFFFLFRPIKKGGPGLSGSAYPLDWILFCISCPHR